MRTKKGIGAAGARRYPRFDEARVPQPDPSLGIAELRAAIHELQVNKIEVVASEKWDDDELPTLWLGFKLLTLEDLGVRRPEEHPTADDTGEEVTGEAMSKV